jgi:hypothetical protein
MIRTKLPRQAGAGFSLRAFAIAFWHMSAVTVGATLLACSGSDSPTAPRGLKPLRTEQCNGEAIVDSATMFTFPSDSGLSTNSVDDPFNCVVITQDAEIEGTMVVEAAPSDQVSAGVWDGQSFSYADVADAEGVIGRCYDIIDNFKFSKIIEGETEIFYVPVVAHKTGDLPESVVGIDRARYQLPDMWIPSRSGKWQSFGGTVDMTCLEAKYQVRLPTFGVYINVRAYLASNANTRISRIPYSGGGGGKPTGWLYYEPGRGIANGNAGGWEGALDDFLSFGTCTDEWDVWVDGKQVCKDGEVVSQT